MAKIKTAAAIPDEPVPPETKRTKLQILIGLLDRPEGASMAQMMAATDWQAHSVRGAIAGVLKRKGFKVTSSKAEDGRRWRFAVEAGE